MKRLFPQRILPSAPGSHLAFRVVEISASVTLKTYRMPWVSFNLGTSIGRLKSEAVEMAVENRDTLDRIFWNEVHWGQLPVVTMISGGGKRGVHGDGMVDENPAGSTARGGQQA